MFETEKQLDGATLRARCPHCYKLFSIHAGEISEARPRFECTDCHGQFWLPFPESLENSAGMIGFPLEAEASNFATEVEEDVATNFASEAFPVENFALPDFNLDEPSPIAEPQAPPQQTRVHTLERAEAKPFSCPKCGAAYAGGEAECVKCGVIFQKFFTKLPVRSDFAASKELKALWEAVILEYEKEDRHRNFIQYGQNDGNLEYVLRKYKDVQEASSSDELSKKFVKEVSATMVAQAESKLVPTKGFKFFAWREWSIPRFNFSPLLYIIGAAVVAFGTTVPGMRNFIGLGCSILFLGVAVRFYFAKPSN